ncbi:hypothetical protein ELY33_17100 [Vreelandella andesensis]|uniref:Uncharacterized protein n=1 Tax=Vreelandella andesensis TaxID=447567 RepID=A0A433KF76_9GAMM|nr:hypothetical protein [Halomonas andesensis]RUR26825.1 hypothetical protein ELY33_17100 [Halomonas andesensis]
MIMISSKAGQRLAKAKASRDDQQMIHSGGGDNWRELRNARHQFAVAAEDLADELIADFHHCVEGD